MEPAIERAVAKVVQQLRHVVGEILGPPHASQGRFGVAVDRGQRARAVPLGERRRHQPGVVDGQIQALGRSGGFEPLRFLPADEVVVLGLVNTKRSELEDREMLLRRIEEASQYADVEQLCLSPQCGFSSTVEGHVLSRDQLAKKRRLIAKTAQEVWG